MAKEGNTGDRICDFTMLSVAIDDSLLGCDVKAYIEQYQKSLHMLLIRKMMKNALIIGKKDSTRMLKIFLIVLNLPKIRSTLQLRKRSNRLKGKPSGSSPIMDKLTTNRSNKHHLLYMKGQNHRL
jgi:hypothetical protein